MYATLDVFVYDLMPRCTNSRTHNFVANQKVVSNEMIKVYPVQVQGLVMNLFTWNGTCSDFIPLPEPLKPKNMVSVANKIIFAEKVGVFVNLHFFNVSAGLDHRF
jgi:hypothetical protein